MSRIGNAEIVIPEGVTIEVNDGGRFGHKTVKVAGPKGEMSVDIRAGIEFDLAESSLNLSRKSEAKQMKANHGLYRSLINNMVVGVTEGYSRELDIVGIGYRAEQQGTKTVFSIGLSHRIEYEPPEGIVVEVEDQTHIKVSGIDKQKVGEVAAKIRSFRKPEPYKGKGIKYTDEVIRRKSAKTVVAE